MSQEDLKLVCKICGYDPKGLNASFKAHVKSQHHMDYEEYSEKYGDIITTIKEHNRTVKFVEDLLQAEFRDTVSFTDDEVNDPETTERIKVLFRYYLDSLGGKGMKAKHRQAMVRVIKYFPQFSHDEILAHFIKMIEYKGKVSEDIDYLTLMFGEDLAKQKMEAKSNRVKGENNPGYQHGGKFSAFSKNFIKPQSEEERQAFIKKTSENRSYTTQVDYYINKGMDQEDAENALSERQAVGRLSKFIERYGKEEGTNRWNERQIKWQNTMDAKSDEEKRDINIKKMPKTSFMNHTYENPDALAHVYLTKLQCELTDKTFYKIGATTMKYTKSRHNAIQKDSVQLVEIVAETKRGKVGDIGDIEYRMHRELREKVGIFDLGRKFNGWTECYELSDEQANKIKNVISKL